MDPISVDLRLALDAFKGDVQKAEAYLKEKLKGAGASTGTGGRAAGGQVGGFNDLNPGLNDVALASNRLAKNARVTEEKANKAAAKAISDKANFMKDMSFLMMPLMQPGSPWGTLFASRQVFSAFTKTGVGQSIAGGTLKGAAMMTAGLIAGTMVVGLALKGLAKVISGVIESIHRAERRYANALVSGGLSVGFTTRRSTLAAVIGVSEKEVFEYGRAIMYLNEKLRWSNKVTADATTPLTEVGWAWKVMKENLAAIFTQIGHGSSGAMKAFVSQLGDLFETLGQTDLFEDFGKAIGTLAKVLNFASGVVNAAASLIVVAFQAIANSVGWMIKKIVNLLAKVPGASRLGIKRIEESDSETFAGTTKGWEAWKKQAQRVMDNLTGFNQDKMPPPQAYMKQLPVSSWEKMGLVIGGGGRANYDAQTAQNTRKIVEKLDGLRNALIPRSGQFTIDTAYANP